MVEEYKELVSELEKIEIIKLFAILKMDDLTDRWSLVFAIEDHDNFEKHKELFRQIIDVAREKLDRNIFENIARGALFSLGDHLIQDLSKIPLNQEFTNLKANGNYIHLGYILIKR